MTDSTTMPTFDDEGGLRAPDGPGPTEPKSWKAEVIADSSGKFCGNAVRFPTKEKALDWVRGLYSGWIFVVKYRVTPSEDAPTEGY